MKLLIATLVLLTSISAYSKCEITYDRTACKGKEKDSYAKCEGGAKKCTKVDPAEDEAECIADAAKACENSRLDITKSKIITAKWNGKEITSKSGKKDFCEDYAKRDKEFNKCE